MFLLRPVPLGVQLFDSINHPQFLSSLTFDMYTHLILDGTEEVYREPLITSCGVTRSL